MKQEKITNIVRQILILVGTALTFFGIDSEIIEAGKEIVFVLVGVIFNIIAMVGLIRSKEEATIGAASYDKPSIAKGIIHAFKMK